MGAITTLFLDIGGVLLSNGWDAAVRKKAADTFRYDFEEMEVRHERIYPSYEKGEMSLDSYLEQVLFTRDRNFSMAEYREFMFGQTRAYPEMSEFFRELKSVHRLKVMAVSNEGRELTEYRVKTFGLATWIDFFVSSCFVRLRKPDARIFRLALDLAQVPGARVAYVDDRPGGVEAARTLGIHAVRHMDYASTRASMETLGLPLAA
jgi:putative hydrolase of the HAD superfamily